VARCPQDASLTQLARELHTTIDVVRRLIDEAGIHRSSPKVRSARQRRRATDQRLTRRAGQLGFADLGAYLADRVTKRAWTLVQVASELGIHRDTVSDRLDRHGLRRPGWPCAESAIHPAWVMPLHPSRPDYGAVVGPCQHDTPERPR
jgi:hypothetical protein